MAVFRRSLVLLLVLAGCSGEVDSSPVVTPSTTPRPSVEQAEVIEAEVAGIYPGVPEGKAVDWARSTCQSMLAGTDESTLVSNVQERFAGGDRPDPTLEQAEAILDVIVRSGFCSS